VRETVKVWDAATRQEPLTLKGQTGEVRSMAFSPDGHRLASGSLDGTVKVWDAATGQEMLTRGPEVRNQFARRQQGPRKHGTQPGRSQRNLDCVIEESSSGRFGPLFNRFLLKALSCTDPGARTRRPDDRGLVSHLQGGHVSPAAFRD
jgi:WD40 repeat protein